VGAAIGTFLSAAEGIAIQSKPLATRGAAIGLGVGILGGAIGAGSAQLGYAAISSSTRSQPGVEEIVSEGTVFSTEVRHRLKEAGARSGEIEIALSWGNRNDLDLHVIDPSSERIFFENRKAASGGELDVDRNAGCESDVTAKPVEHIVWDKTDAQPGTYEVLVHHYANCGISDPTSFQVEIKVGDRSLGSFDHELSHGGPPMIISRFEYTTASTFSTKELDAGPWVGPLVSRILGWAIFGALVGCAEGLTRRSKESVRNAAIGGLIGGSLGGLLFQLVASAGLGDVSSRFLGFVVLGGCIGLWIVLVEQALSSVFTVLAGRFEGRQILLDKPEMRIGRDDKLEIYLGDDSEIAPHHATLRTELGRHVILQEEGVVQVNDLPVSKQTLNNGDRILIGKTRLAYKHKRGAAAGHRTASQPMQAPVKAAPPPPKTQASSSADSAPVTNPTPGASAFAGDASETGRRSIESKEEFRSVPKAPPPPPKS